MTSTTPSHVRFWPPMSHHGGDQLSVEGVQAMLTESPVTVGADGQVTALVYWRHRRGGQAHCLARLFPVADRVIAVVSELASNRDDLGIANDFAAVADAVLHVAREYVDAAPESIVWLAHHGAFSSAGAFDPDTFTLIPLEWKGDGYHDDLRAHEVLPADTVNLVLHSVKLAQVVQAVDALQQR